MTYFITFLLFLSIGTFADTKLIQLSSEDLAVKGAVDSPEGLAITSDGTIFAGAMLPGKIYISSPPHFTPHLFADISMFKSWRKGSSRLMGLAAESNDLVWSAVTSNDGCIMLSQKKENNVVSKPAICGLGEPNALHLAQNIDKLYVTTKVAGLGSSGKVLSISLKEMKEAVSAGKTLTIRRANILAEADMPNGLTISAGRSFLLFAQTMDDRITALDRKSGQTFTWASTNEDGWVDGLAHIPEYKVIAASDSKLGNIYFYTTGGTLLSKYKFKNHRGELTGPANLVVYGDYLYFTDLWEGSLADLVIGNLMGEQLVTYHSEVYRVHLSRLLNKPKR